MLLGFWIYVGAAAFGGLAAYSFFLANSPSLKTPIPRSSRVTYGVLGVGKWTTAILSKYPFLCNL
jgi:hypothetical protein